MALVTFIIVAYNAEEWIEEALKFVINQTRQDLQVIDIMMVIKIKLKKKFYLSII